MDSTCIIIKKKEYKAMQKELQELRSKNMSDITITFYDRRHHYGNAVDFRDSVDFSSGIRLQVVRIVRKIYSNQESYAIGRVNSKIEELQEVFDSLPWYKKLTFEFK